MGHVQRQRRGQGVGRQELLDGGVVPAGGLVVGGDGVKGAFRVSGLGGVELEVDGGARDRGDAQVGEGDGELHPYAVGEGDVGADHPAAGDAAPVGPRAGAVVGAVPAAEFRPAVIVPACAGADDVAPDDDVGDEAVGEQDGRPADVGVGGGVGEVDGVVPGVAGRGARGGGVAARGDGQAEGAGGLGTGISGQGDEDVEVLAVVGDVEADDVGPVGAGPVPRPRRGQVAGRVGGQGWPVGRVRQAVQGDRRAMGREGDGEEQQDQGQGASGQGQGEEVAWNCRLHRSLRCKGCKVPRLYGRDVEGPGQFVAAEREPRLGADGVPRAQARRFDAEALPRLQNTVPQRGGLIYVC
jgi:hypothetical protein